MMPNSVAFGLYQLAVAVQLVGGLLSLAAWRHNRLAGIVGVMAALVGAALGLVGAGLALAGGSVATAQLAWSSLGLDLHLRLDGLAAFFLVPIFLLLFTGALYATGYLRLPHRSWQGARHWFCFNLLGASMALVVGAADSLLFLIAWELMAISSFLLVIFDLTSEAARRAGWIYLVATHLGTAFLLYLFFEEYRLTGVTEFASFSILASLPPGGAALFFTLALIGFGTKAGLFPMHSWLPEAHAAAPSHVSALMSGVMIKTAVYAFLRIITFLPQLPPWCGLLVAALGGAGALAGIALASQQNDLKRSLAYSTVENIGLTFLGLGLWLYCRGKGLEEAGTLLLAGALLHVWNHALFKSLLFFGAGSLLQATGTREISRMGGLLRRLPVTGILLLLGGGAIAALPPLNGLVSEWLLYRGLLQAGQGSLGGQAFLFMLFTMVLAMVGALVLLTMTRIIGICLLGEPRSPESWVARESAPAMLAAMLIVALGCLAVGMLPDRALSLLAGPLSVLAPGVAGPDPAGQPFGPAWSWVALLFSLVLAALVAIRCRHWLVDSRLTTWGCGFRKPSSRMSYTAGGFGQLAQETVYCAYLRPTITGERRPDLFPAAWQWLTDLADPLLARGFTPLFARIAALAATGRGIQSGQLSLYFTYFFAATLLLLGWAIFF
ncbi:MAG: oxidoreductase [Desulfobulbaceae bacterium]|nr:oxidoreductase [Desulfobulbaceae bacterium]